MVSDGICPHTERRLVDWQFSSDFYLEPKTGILYYKEWKPLSYEDDYFFEEYRRQYGKTYLDDEENIRFLARKRLYLLSRFLRGHNSLLEFGCASGFFLDEARKTFSRVQGIEVSEFAINYATEKLKLNVERSDVLSFFRHDTSKYDIIASFYVVEHIDKQKELFQAISSHLTYGGLWIASIPSTYGPFFQFHREAWIRNHPQDHFVDYNPEALREILKLYGMKLLFLKPESYHQERTKGILYYFPDSLYKLYANTFSYGDTILFIAKRLD